MLVNPTNNERRMPITKHMTKPLILVDQLRVVPSAI